MVLVFSVKQHADLNAKCSCGVVGWTWALVVCSGLLQRAWPRNGFAFPPCYWASAEFVRLIFILIECLICKWCFLFAPLLLNVCESVYLLCHSACLWHYPADLFNIKLMGKFTSSSSIVREILEMYQKFTQNFFFYVTSFNCVPVGV